MCANVCSNPDPSIPVSDNPGSPVFYSSTILVFHFETCTALGNFKDTVWQSSL